MADGSTSSPQDDLGSAILANGAGPAKATVDGTSVEQHTLADQVVADKHLGAKKAFNSRGFGLRRARIIPPGATGI